MFSVGAKKTIKPIKNIKIKYDGGGVHEFQLVLSVICSKLSVELDLPCIKIKTDLGSLSLQISLSLLTTWIIIFLK